MIGVGIVGGGFMGQTHAQAYGVLDKAKLVAVADQQMDRAQELAEPHGAIAVSDLSQLLARPDVDVVDICLPTFLHAETAVNAFKAGKHVICEKPMARTLEDADTMIRAAEHAGKVLMVAHVIRFWPEYVALKTLVDSRRLGSLKSLFMKRVSPTPGWSWNSWILDESKSGSAVIDLHIHDADFALFLLGRPLRVLARGSHDRLGWSHIVAFYDYGDGPLVCAEGGWDFPQCYPFDMGFRAVFEGGAADFTLARTPAMMVFGEKGEPQAAECPNAPADMEMASEGNIAELGGYLNELAYFVDCLDRGAECETVTAQHAREALELVLAEVASMESGDWVSF